MSRRAQIVLLAADGWSQRDIRRATFTSYDFITETLRLFRDAGLSGPLADEPPRPLPKWAKRLTKWVATRTPADFGYFHRRWSCETLAEVLAWEAGVRVAGRCTGSATCGDGHGRSWDRWTRTTRSNSQRFMS